MKRILPDLLISPDTFFSVRMEEPQDLRIPGIIVIIGAVIAAVGAYLISGIYAGMFAAAGGEGMATLMGVMGGVSAFFGFIIVWWLVFAGIFHLLSMVFSGTGTFRRTLEHVAFGLVPVVIGSCIALLVSLYYLPMIEVPVITSFQDPAAIQRVMSMILEDPAYRELTRVTSLISVIFLAWSANLWIFGIRHARGLTVKSAMVVVLVPVVIYSIAVLAMAFGVITFPGGFA